MKEKPWRENELCDVSERLYLENRKLFLRFFKDGGGKARLLDLGCMDGEFTLDIARACGAGEISGIEIDGGEAAKARNRGIAVRTADLNRRFPFRSGSFDVVSANQVLEHVSDTHNFLKETNRVLRKGGYAVLSVPNMSSLHSILFILLGQQTPIVHLIDRQVGNFMRGIKVGWHGHSKAFNMPALRDLADIYGFRVERMEGYGVYFLPVFLQRFASRILGRYSIYITVRIRKVSEYRG